jgi:hypothetical protein
MHFIRCAVCFLVLQAAVGLAAEPTWSLPDNPQAVVIELQLETAAGQPVTDVVVVRRDGSFTVGEARSTQPIQSRLTEDELQELLGEIIEREQALELTSASLSAKIQAEGRRTGKDWRIRNASGTIVRISLAGRTHEIRCSSPELLRTRLPGVSELDRVCAIQRRLENIAAVAQVGGLAEAQRLAALATDEWRRQNGPAVQITHRDLLHVRGSAGDLRQVQFVVEPGLHGEAGEAVHVSVIESPGATPRISMTPIRNPL